MVNYTGIDFSKYQNNLSTFNVLDIPPEDILELSSLQVTSIKIPIMYSGLGQLNALNSRTDLTYDQDQQVRKNIEYITKMEIGPTLSSASAAHNFRSRDTDTYRAQLKIAADAAASRASVALSSNLSEYNIIFLTPGIITKLSTVQVRSLTISQLNIFSNEQLTALNTRNDLTLDQIKVVKTKLGIPYIEMTPSEQTIADEIKAGADDNFFQRIINWFKNLFGIKSSFNGAESVSYFLLICIIIYMLLVYLPRHGRLNKRTGRQ